MEKRFKNKQRAISMLIAFLINLITTLLYIEKYGIIIAAISSTIAYFFAMSWNIYNSKISLKNIIGFSSLLNFLLICLFYILFYILNITSLVISITFLAYSLYFLIKELRNYKSLSERLSL